MRGPRPSARVSPPGLRRAGAGGGGYLGRRLRPSLRSAVARRGGGALRGGPSPAAASPGAARVWVGPRRPRLLKAPAPPRLWPRARAPRSPQALGGRPEAARSGQGQESRFFFFFPNWRVSDLGSLPARPEGRGESLGREQGGRVGGSPRSPPSPPPGHGCGAHQRAAREHPAGAVHARARPPAAAALPPRLQPLARPHRPRDPLEAQVPARGLHHGGLGPAGGRLEGVLLPAQPPQEPPAQPVCRRGVRVLEPGRERGRRVEGGGALWRPEERVSQRPGQEILRDFLLHLPQVPGGGPQGRRVLGGADGHHAARHRGQGLVRGQAGLRVQVPAVRPAPVIRARASGDLPARPGDHPAEERCQVEGGLAHVLQLPARRPLHLVSARRRGHSLLGRLVRPAGHQQQHHHPAPAAALTPIC